MRRLLVAIGLLGLASNAFAADYELPALRGTTGFLPATPRYFRWEGFYFGGQVTYGSANADFFAATQPLIAFSLRQLVLESVAAPSTWQVLGSSDTTSAGFGGFVGYNMQWDNAVVGLELNYTRSSFTNVAPSSPIGREVTAGGNTYDVTLTASGSMHVQDFVTMRSRGGWAFGNYLPYAMFGVAVGRADLSVSTNVTGTQTGPNPNPPPDTIVVPFSFTNNKSKNQAFIYGYTIGAGLEVALTPNIFVRGEIEHIQWAALWQISSNLNIGRAAVGLKF
jgi:outer membrane immunogenic protein